MIYTGIGARKTPNQVKIKMAKLGYWLAKDGRILRSGGAKGADIAFQNACVEAGGKKEIFLPWERFNNHFGDDFYYEYGPEVTKIAMQYHPKWHRLSYKAKKMHTRNVCQVLGYDLKTPTKCVICWTEKGEKVGGTSQAIRIADDKHIPVFNLFHIKDVENLKKELDKYVF